MTKSSSNFLEEIFRFFGLAFRTVFFWKTCFWIFIKQKYYVTLNFKP